MIHLIGFAVKIVLAAVVLFFALLLAEAWMFRDRR
jgi:hypothetical protein